MAEPQTQPKTPPCLAPFELAICEAVAQKRVTGAAVAAIWDDRDGSHLYLDAFGKESLLPGSADMSATSSLLWLASCTKLVTAICCMQLVHAGHITLDDPLSTILPELAPPLPVLTSPSSDGTTPPTTTTTTTPLTLRHLLTHTSGLAYEHNHPAILAWRAAQPPSSPYHPNNLPAGAAREITSTYFYPLLFEPSAPGRWEYGCGIDWAGKVVERVNPEGLKLGAYMARHVFAPLGIAPEDMTFHPALARTFPRSLRDVAGDGSLSVDPMIMFPHVDYTDEAGGHGLYGTVAAYLRIVASLARDDGKILAPAAAAELFRPQLPASDALQTRLARNSDAQAMVFETELEAKGETVRWNWSLCGLVAMQDVPGKVSEGSGLWSGMPNLNWWVDRKMRTAGVYGSQLFPLGDEVSERLWARMQMGVCGAAAAAVAAEEA